MSIIAREARCGGFTDAESSAAKGWTDKPRAFLRARQGHHKYVDSFLFFLIITSNSVIAPKREQIKGTSTLTSTRAYCGCKVHSRPFPTPQTVSNADGLWEKWSSAHSWIHSSHGELFLDAKSKADRKQREVLSNWRYTKNILSFHVRKRLTDNYRSPMQCYGRNMVSGVVPYDRQPCSVEVRQANAKCKTSCFGYFVPCYRRNSNRRCYIC